MLSEALVGFQGLSEIPENALYYEAIKVSVNLSTLIPLHTSDRLDKPYHIVAVKSTNIRTKGLLLNKSPKGHRKSKPDA